MTPFEGAVEGSLEGSRDGRVYVYNHDELDDRATPLSGTQLGSVEVGQHVRGAALEGPAEGDDLAQCRRDAVADRLDQRCHQLAALRAVGLPVGADHALVDAPGGFDLDVLVGGEERFDPLALSVGEQVGSGVQGPSGAVERVAGAATVTAGVLLDAASAPVQGVAGQADHVGPPPGCTSRAPLASTRSSSNFS